MVTNELDSPFDGEELVYSKSKVSSSNATQRNVELSFLIQQEFSKYMQAKNTSTHYSQANFSQTHFVGNSLTQNSVGKSIGFLENS